MTAPALELRGIHRRFGGIVALGGVDLVLRPGTVHALLGENGAGKTTLMRVAFGLVTPDAGATRVAGAEVRLKSPADAMRLGIGMVQQHFTLVPALSTTENIALGWSSGQAIRERATRLAAETGFAFDPDTPVDQLSVADQQRIEILKALTRGARTLILDEPTAALAPRDASDLFSWIRRFTSGGGSVVLITHKLGEAMSLADDITVLRRGTVTWQGRRPDATMDGLVIAMLGAHLSTEGGVRRVPAAHPAETPHAVGDRMVIVDDRGTVKVRDAAVRVRPGEIVGVAGVEGSGVHEFLYAMAGRRALKSGSLRLPDRVGFVPEDRHRDALLMNASVAENVALKGAGARRGWLRRETIEKGAERLVAANDVRVSSVRAPVSTLSGGNQQRLVLARELDDDPLLVIAINPTRGLDIGAANHVRARLRGAAGQGAGVLYYSADIDELLEIADRMLVVYDGRVSESACDRDAIGRAMLGAA